MIQSSTFDLYTILIGLLGGLALFLFGLEQVTQALRIIAGQQMKQLLANMTTSRFKSVLTGILMTAVIQSSSVTTVLIVGAISASLLSLPQSIGVILGAALGSTITPQIIAFKVTQYGLVLVFGGFMLRFMIRREKSRHYGRFLVGLGLLFFSLDLISQATKPLQSFPFFLDLMQEIANPLISILIGLIFTALIQSSAATIGMVMVLASQNFMSLETGIALTLGANIGTCSTALLASLDKPRDAVRAAVVHLLLRTLGVILWYPYIDQFALFIQIFSPQYPDLLTEARLAAEVPRQIANAHTLYNLFNILLFIWFTKSLAWLMYKLVPPSEPTLTARPVGPVYLESLLLQTPALALDRVKAELNWVGAYNLRMLHLALPTVFYGTQDDLVALAQMDDEIDTLHRGIVTYLGRLSQKDLTRDQSKQLYDYIAAANYLENIGDLIAVNLTDIGQRRLRQEVQISTDTQNLLDLLYDKVSWTLDQSVEALFKANKMMANEVIAAKNDVNHLANQVNNHLVRHLPLQDANQILIFRLESELLESLKRMYYFAKRIAKITAETEDGHIPQEAR